jgi:hypothetical protein
MITETTNCSDLNLLLDACEEYMLTSTIAGSIISKVKTTMASWRSLATRIGIVMREIDYFSSKLDSYI